jgi:phosphoglycolate phosphatase/putative hydrolase of the HAD superfamily
MDNTLYTHPVYAQHQEEVLVGRLAQEFQVSIEEAQGRVDAYRKGYAQEHGGHKPSLGNTFLALGISIQVSVEWRNELIQPERFLSNDEKLRGVLQELSRGFSLGVVTNNPVGIARRTLRVLGVEELFSAIIGLDTTLESKPSVLPFQAVCAQLSCEPPRCISIGDRYAVDIVPALELGMGGILVEAVEDVYRLPEVLGEVLAEACAEVGVKVRDQVQTPGGRAGIYEDSLE